MSDKLRVLLLTEEDRLYLPLSIQYVLEHSKHTIHHVCCLRNPTLGSAWRTIQTFTSIFGIGPLLKYALRLVQPVALDFVPVLNRSSRSFSVKRTTEHYGKSYRRVADVNDREFLDWVHHQRPDLIVSVSPTQIFRSRLIKIPRLGCLNVHSSLLPKYRGLYPVYWAMSAGESEVGVSVHYITPSLDSGDVVLQGSLPLTGIRTMHQALIEAKLLGARLLTEAIDSAARGELTPTVIDIEQGTYHSLPDRDSYRRFRELGYRLW
jgi:methionyl-tRNA formyltransferase